MEQAFLWTQARGMVGLGFLPGSTYSFPNAVSSDGSVVVGTSSSAGGYPGFRWTQSTGMVSIGNLPGRQTTHPFGVSTDGRFIVGSSFSDPAHGNAFIWDAEHGIRNLQSVLQADYNLNLTGWTLEAASGITPNGKVIVGWGTNPSGQTEAFRVEASFLPDSNGPVLNVSTGERFAGIQEEIEHAQSGQVIQVEPGTYTENVSMAGRDLVLQSVDSSDPNTTAVMILEGNGTDPGRQPAR
jgi:probable HAF family extracellular repeat protein